MNKRWRLEIPGLPGKSSLTIGDRTWLANWADLLALPEQVWRSGDMWHVLRNAFESVGEVVK